MCYPFETELLFVLVCSFIRSFVRTLESRQLVQAVLRLMRLRAVNEAEPETGLGDGDSEDRAES